MTELIVNNPQVARTLLKLIQSQDPGEVYLTSSPGTPVADANAVDAAIPLTATAIRIWATNSIPYAMFEDASDGFK